MGVPEGSMTLAELSEAIPPAYSRFVAEAFLSASPAIAPEAEFASALLSGVAINYCTELTRAFALLKRMAASGKVALDIETAAKSIRGRARNRIEGGEGFAGRQTEGLTQAEGARE